VIKHALVVGGTRGIGAAVVKALEAQGEIVDAVGRGGLDGGLSPFVFKNGQFTHIILCQRFRGEGDAWDGEIKTSLTLTRDVIENGKHMFDGDPSNCIIITSSVIAHSVADEQPVSYHMAKSALEGMIRYYAVTLGKKGIRVNGISPAVTLKPENKEFYDSHPARVEMYKKHIPIGRMITVEDVANVVLFLCSSASSVMTGQTLVVDGGVSLLNQESLMRRSLKEGE
jgi:NAD(P)-dependent dehydrogenase (short-subunit alcohol dehydrogenase family)